MGQLGTSIGVHRPVRGVRPRVTPGAGSAGRRCGGTRSSQRGLAAEEPAGYRADTDPSATSTTSGTTRASARTRPAGAGALAHEALTSSLWSASPAASASSAALAECEELAELVQTLAAVDRLSARAVELMGRLHASGDAEAATGLDVDTWLATVGRRTRADRRMLATAAQVLSRMPQLAESFAHGAVSWAQVRAVVLQCVRLPDWLCRRVDELLARQMVRLQDADPDELARMVGQAVATLDDRPSTRRRDTREADRAAERRFVHVQPELDGAGGRVFAELDALGLAVFVQATDPGPDTGDGRTPGRRRADALIDRLAGAQTRPHGRPHGRPHDDDTSPGDQACADADAPSRGHDPARDATCAGGHEPGHDGPPAGAKAPPDAVPHGTASPAGAAAGLAPVAPTLLVTCTLEQLLGAEDGDADLLVGLTGGRLRLPSALARRLADANGAAVRLLVVEETGRLLGVGRRTHRPPGWLAEATLALQPTCAEPGCDRPAVHADVDHITPWSRRGTTDLDNLQRLCRHANRTRQKAGWDITTTADGDRVWTHQRTGVRARNVPATFRLARPGDRPPHPRNRRGRDPTVDTGDAGDAGAPGGHDPPDDPDMPF